MNSESSTLMLEVPKQLIENLQKQLSDLQIKLSNSEKRCEQYVQAYDQLHHQLDELLRYRYGKKSERYIDDEQPQLSLFASTAISPSVATAETNLNESSSQTITVTAHSRHKNKKSSKEVVTRIEIIPVSDADRQCACGECKNVIRYETKLLMHHQQEVFEVIEQRREVVACAKGCDKSIITAPAPLQILPKVKATEEFLSFLVVSKLDDRQPLYHLKKQLSERYGIDCSRQTMARWLIDLMTPLQPMFNLLKDNAIDYDVGSCDATTLQVLNEPGRKAETKSYVYCIRGGPPGKEVILYAYNDRQQQAFINDWFQGFTGYLHVDGDNFFNLIGETAALVNCHAHARRKFEPIAKGTKGKGLAKEALLFYKQLYKIERDAKNDQLTPEHRYELRQQQSKPLLAKFKQWLDENYPLTLPQSPLGQAMHYSIKLWQGLTRFLKDGRLEIDNNGTEREIKPLVIARKNFLFCASVDGAHALCMHMSLIRTAKKHGLDPYHYYVKLLKSIPYCKTLEDYEKLLPWNIRLAYAKNIN